MSMSVHVGIQASCVHMENTHHTLYVHVYNIYIYILQEADKSSTKDLEAFYYTWLVSTCMA